MCEMPRATGRLPHVALTAGGHPVGRFHDAPPSVLRQMPPPDEARKSSRAVAMIVFGSSDAMATSIGANVGKPPKCWKLIPLDFAVLYSHKSRSLLPASRQLPGTAAEGPSLRGTMIS